MLRQTRADMVANIWPEFIERYPDPSHCANASSAELYSLVAPLGLGRQRVEALQAVSRALVKDHRGKVPRRIDSLLSLPHVGLYTAHAVACFAFGRKVPVVDGNVIRLFSRLMGAHLPPDNRRVPEVWSLAWRILPSKGVREHNYGILDFCADVCKPLGPQHDGCPLAPICAENQSDPVSMQSMTRGA